MNHASGKDYDPSAWAKQRQERIKRASQVSTKSRDCSVLHYKYRVPVAGFVPAAGESDGAMVDRYTML